jgi:lysophospholipase L1-like esterase
LRDRDMRKKNIVIIWLLAILLVASVGLHLCQFIISRHYYAEMLSVRLDPFGEGEVISARHQVTEHGVELLVLGDSRAFSWPRPSTVAKERFRNLGVNSQTTAQILGRIQGDPLSTKAEIVVLQAGINDLKSIPLFPERKDEIVSACKTNIRSIVEHCAEQSDIVIITTIFPPGTPSLARRPVWSSDIATAVEEVNDFLVTLATERILILDSAALLKAENGRLDRRFAKNTLHPNKIGYERLNRELRSMIER